jgi:hypothetical protein
MNNKSISTLSVLASALVLAACAPQQSNVQMGSGNSLVSGSAGGAASVDANKSLIRCPAPLGTLAVDDGRFEGTRSVTTVDPLLRLAVQQSNCFVLTAIGNQKTSQTLNRITDTQRDSGEYRAGSKQEKGQRVAADYLLEPQVVVDNETTGGEQGSVGGGLLGALAGAAGGPLAGALVGAASKATETKTTVVALTLTDIRSTVQIGISEGSAVTTNMGSSIGGWGGLMGIGGSGFAAGGVGAGMSSFTRTPEGMSTAAAFFDAYNGMVQSLKNYKAQEVKGGMGQGGLLKVN